MKYLIVLLLLLSSCEERPGPIRKRAFIEACTKFKCPEGQISKVVGVNFRGYDDACLCIPNITGQLEDHGY